MVDGNRLKVRRQMSDDVLIKAEHVSKKFCRSLKRSLWYGVKDIAHAIAPWNATAEDRDEECFGALPALRKGEFWAVQDVSFELRRGECMGLIGHNGAGKSTLLKILNSLIRPDSGQITMRGRVGALIELSAGFNPILSGRENIYNQAALFGFSKKETDAKFDAIVDFSELEDFLDMPIQNYSSGMRVKLGFAVFTQLDPDILFIDEVLAVGDVAFRFKCLNAMADTLKNAAVVFVSHSMPQVFRVATSIMLMRAGTVGFYGHDVGEGIEKYLSMGSGPEQSITGSGAAVVRDCVVSVDGQTCHLGDTVSIRPDSAMRIALRIEFSPTVESARVQALVWNQEMIPVTEIVSQEGLGYLALPSETGAVDIDVDIPPLHLNGGRHMLTVNIVSQDYKTVFCRHDNAVTLNVLNTNVSGASCIVHADWRQS